MLSEAFGISGWICEAILRYFKSFDSYCIWLERSSCRPFDLLMKCIRCLAVLKISILKLKFSFWKMSIFCICKEYIKEVFIFIGVAGLLHHGVPCGILHGKDRGRSLLAEVWQSLKKANYENFDILLEAFRHYDKVNALKEM